MQNPSQKMMEGLLADIADTMKLITTHQGPIGKIENPETVKQNLDMWEKFLQAVNNTLEDMTPPGSPTPELSPEQEAFLQRAKEIEQQGHVLEKAFASALGKTRKRAKGKNGEKEAELQQQMKERRKLFKTIGGDKKWIPM